MKRILLTGMSGTGKSTLINELAARGYQAVDLDCDAFSEWVAMNDSAGDLGNPVEPGRDWVWREDRVQELLSAENTDILFVSGCASNMRKFVPQFNQTILLSAPAQVIVERLKARTNNLYGKQADEVTRILGLIETVEPFLRRAADYEIDTSGPLDNVVTAVIQIAQL